LPTPLPSFLVAAACANSAATAAIIKGELVQRGLLRRCVGGVLGLAIGAAEASLLERVTNQGWCATVPRLDLELLPARSYDSQLSYSQLSYSQLSYSQLSYSQLSYSQLSYSQLSHSVVQSQ
jgi:hypothetical protein